MDYGNGKTMKRANPPTMGDAGMANKGTPFMGNVAKVDNSGMIIGNVAEPKQGQGNLQKQIQDSSADVV